MDLGRQQRHHTLKPELKRAERKVSFWEWISVQEPVLVWIMMIMVLS